MIYRKTAKGLTEIETRAQRLNPRLRSLLILVDGKRDVAAIRALVQQPTDEALDALARQGFIEALAAAPEPAPASQTAAAVPQRPAPASPAAAWAPAAAPLPAPAARTPSQTLPFASLRATAVRELLDVVGPNGDGLAMRMEKARSMPELQPLLVMATRMMIDLGARPAAERYTQRFLTGA